MAKATFTIGYTNYVMDVKDALTIAEMLAKCEIYENKYHGVGKDSTYHIYPCDKKVGTIELLTDEQYRLYKLAGKPEAS